jgi:hypothetical protein
LLFFTIPDSSESLLFLQSPRCIQNNSLKTGFFCGLTIIFYLLVNFVEPICQAFYSAKADMTIFDSSRIEAFVTENNPKFANRIIKQIKAYAKVNNFNSHYDLYKATYDSMPYHASSNYQIKQFYVDVHFCYAYKIGIVTNGLGIIRNLDFYNKDFLSSHPLTNSKIF